MVCAVEEHRRAGGVESATGAMKTLIEGLFPKERLLDYVRHFIAFEVVNEKMEKKGAKYHQFFGTRFAVEEALRATRPDGVRKIGVVWHTQGSGKSLSMAYFGAILRHHPLMDNSTFVIQVDRADLDDQLHDQFVAVKALVGEGKHASSVAELRSLPRGEGGEVIFSTIEKFRLDDAEAVHPVLSERRNLIVMADEGHRSKYGLTEGFAYQLRRALPNASFIAKLLADEIRSREKSNLAKYKSFKEMLEQSLQKYPNRAIQAADVVCVLIQIKQDMARESERTKTLNLSAEELAFYDAVSENVATLNDEKFLCDLVQAVKKNLKVDWTKPHREDVKAGVRAAVKTVLRRRGVTSSELLETLTQKIIVQAVEMFMEWSLAA